MLVSDLLNLVKTGNLAETKVTDASLINFLNLGLAELYSKYSLNIKEESYTLTEDTDYVLPSDFISLVKATTSNLFYRDLSGNFTKSNPGIFELSINVLGDYNSVIITDMNTLKIGYPISGQVINILYSAYPKQFTSNNLNTKLPIRDQYLEALTMYMTYLGFMQNGGGSQADSNVYLNRYERACQSLEQRGSLNKLTEFNSKFHDRGYV